MRQYMGYIRTKTLKVTLEGGGGAACEACSAKCITGTNSAFALRPRKTTENLHPLARSLDLPDAD
jgi:hypothetical protein